jgi:hypothetical protein
MQSAGSAKAAAARKAPLRKVVVQRAHTAKGALQAWVCPVPGTNPGDPMPVCTRKVKLSLAKKTLPLPAAMTGKVRIVVVRSAR